MRVPPLSRRIRPHAPTRMRHRLHRFIPIKTLATRTRLRHPSLPRPPPSPTPLTLELRTSRMLLHYLLSELRLCLSHLQRSLVATRCRVNAHATSGPCQHWAAAPHTLPSLHATSQRVNTLPAGIFTKLILGCGTCREFFGASP